VKGSLGLIALSSLLLSGTAIAQEKIKVGVTATLEAPIRCSVKTAFAVIRLRSTYLARRSATRNSSLSSHQRTRHPTPRFAPCAS